MLWRYGATNPRVSPVDSAQVVEIGDLVWLNTDDVRPASAVSYAAGLSQAQETLVDDFLGVAMQSSPSGNTEDIRVATTGVFEFDCAADTFELGDLVAAADNSGSTALEDQKVVSLGDGHADADVPRAIGKAAKVAASNVTRVLVEIRSTVMTGGYPLGTASV
jgi:predicted RecA/RadA family phage recombinase